MSGVLTLKLLRSVRAGMMDIDEKVKNIGSQVRWIWFLSFLCTSNADMLRGGTFGSDMALLKELLDMFLCLLKPLPCCCICLF